MTDFRRIRLGPEERYRKLEPGDTVQFHRRAVRFLETKLQESFAGPTVVITHHTPSPRSIARAFEGSLLNAAYCSDLEWLIEKYRPELWVHGHVHQFWDYEMGVTRVLCNPHGYMDVEEVEAFERDLVVEV